MLAMRASDAKFIADMPLSAVLRAEVDRDGTVQQLEGRVLAGSGEFGARNDPDTRIHIDNAQLNMRWNPITREVQMPLEIQSGPSRVSVIIQLDVPKDPGGAWIATVPRGLIVLASAERVREPP